MNPKGQISAVSGTPADAPLPPEHHALHLREGAARFAWRLRDEGVTLTASGLEWTADGIRRNLAYTEIVEIRLQTGHIPRSGDFGACAIKFRNGVLLTVNSLNSWGTPDDERVGPYIVFVEDLHARLGQEDRGRIRFLAGNTDGRYRFGVFAAVLAGAFFVVLPLVLVFVTGEGEALFLTLAGVFFVYPVIRVIRKNEPRSYNPQRLDDDLFP
ncbi:hypothetical protein [Bauldia litoralis]|uniref:Uncharacterized protein n=1 Tax=Bauldia litoralis TaxID=665467 RepID=A0A1G6AIJ9_9HYPH|nr:hypothetical protein [Bauldia litoralis]SDB08205.1 hypothetical protein SAMN02982931_00686 [Bauldia litoralis]